MQYNPSSEQQTKTNNGGEKTFNGSAEQIM